jgi:hypothetical protein
MTKTISAITGALLLASSAFALGDAPCDRACLLRTADAYLAALVAHDPSKAPMAANVKFTEQTKTMNAGDEGLWKSAISVSTTYRIPIADPVSQQIGVLVMLKADGKAWPPPPARGNAPPPDPGRSPPTAAAARTACTRRASAVPPMLRRRQPASAARRPIARAS